MNVVKTTTAAFFATTLLLGCSSENEPSATPGATDAAEWRLAEAPDDAVSVADAKASAQPGDAVTVTGNIGGRLDPISPESGLFVLMDTSVQSCAELGSDHCATPWDYCCEPPENISKFAATVQLRDAAGQPITLNEGDLKPLDQVVVVGKVAPGSSDTTLVIHASEIATP